MKLKRKKLILIKLFIAILLIIYSCNFNAYTQQTSLCNKNSITIEIFQTDFVTSKKLLYTVTPNKLSIDSLYNYYSEKKEIYYEILKNTEYLSIISFVPDILMLNEEYKNVNVIDGTQEEILIYENDIIVKRIKITNFLVPVIYQMLIEINSIIEDGSKRIIFL